jgi:uncharacterized protein YndB with AHSA1/START domain
MIKKILLGFFGLLAFGVAAMVAYAFTQSDDMVVTRSATIAAPPEAVFKVVNDFRLWDKWSPWSKLDPEMKVTLEGPAEGVGAIYRWAGNNEVGEGTTSLVGSVPNEKIDMKLEFVRPFPGTSEVEFTFAAKEGGTEVAWTMRGKKPFIGKMMSLFMDCEKMCGDQFLEGLANLKTLVEKPAQS